MGWLYALSFVIMLTGCSNPVDQIAKCEYEAQRMYPDQTLATSNKIAAAIQLCMKAAGYDWDMSSDKCQPGFEAEANPYCYVRR